MLCILSLLEEVMLNPIFTQGPPAGLIHKIGSVPPKQKQDLTIYHGATLVYRSSRSTLQQNWASNSHQMQRRRDNPICADAEQLVFLFLSHVYLMSFATCHIRNVALATSKLSFLYPDKAVLTHNLATVPLFSPPPTPASPTT